MTITDVTTIRLRPAQPRPPSRPDIEACTNPWTIFKYAPWREARSPRGPGSQPVNMVVVQVHTDDGLVGMGDIMAGQAAADFILHHHLKHLVIGHSPFDVELLWEKMYRASVNYGRKGAVLEAMSGIDIALWDLMGKATGQPVYNLMGGKVWPKMRVYASRLYGNQNPDELAAETEKYLAQGFTAMKLRFSWGPPDGRKGMRQNEDLVRTVREVAGEDVELAGDAYMGWDAQYAIAMIRRLERFELSWVEEPVMPDDLESYARIRRSVGTRISGGEHEFTKWGFRQLIEKGAVDILQPDINRVGGLTEANKICAMAQAEGLQVTPHAGQSHNYHLTTSHINCPIAEYFPRPDGPPDGNEFFWDVFNEPEAVDGHVTLSGKPGLGLELNPEAVEKYGIT